MQAPRYFMFTVAFSPLDSNIGTPKIKLGDKVTVYNDSKQRIFTGFIVSRERKSEAGTLSYTAKDNMMHLLRSKGTYKFTNKTPEQIAKNVCADAGILIERLAKTKINIDKAFFSERPIYEIIMAGYTRAHRKNGKVYIAQMSDRRLSVVEKGKIIPKFQLKQGERIITSTLTETNESMVNRVAIYNSENQKIGEISNDNWVKTYGVFQESLTAESGTGKAEAKNMLFGIEKTADVSCLGDTRCVSGRGVVIQDTKTGLNGVFWIESDEHTWENNAYTMELSLAFKNFMDEQEFDEEPERQTDNSGISTTGSTQGILNGRKVKARFTAYWPGPGIEGGPLDAFDTPLSHFLNNGINVVATPPSIPKDTQIQILGTGTSRDGGTYITRDRGGAIQILSDGTYRFDILMRNDPECNAWGVRDGYAIIGDGTGYTSGSSGSGAGNSVADDVLNEARKHIGYKEYGGNGTKFGEAYGWNYVAWCCIFCWYCFSYSGHAANFYGGGKSAHCFTVMEWYQRQGKTTMTPKPGYLAIFWGSGGLGHIGIVETVNGSSYTCIEGNASSATDGVYRINRTVGGTRTFCITY